MLFVRSSTERASAMRERARAAARRTMRSRWERSASRTSRLARRCSADTSAARRTGSAGSGLRALEDAEAFGCGDVSPEVLPQAPDSVAVSERAANTTPDGDGVLTIPTPSRDRGARLRARVAF